MSLKKFLAIGDLLINPDLLAYAAFEEDAGGPRLRLGFATPSGIPGRAEVRLSGEEAGVAIRWLRLNSTSLTREGAFGPIARPIEATHSRQALETRAIEPEPVRCVDRGVFVH
jgi:hypothetical protein